MKSGLPDNENIRSLHEKGHIAVHAISSPSVIPFMDKMDDRRILNNLREDGGTDVRARQNYELFTQISATVTPPAEYPIGQRVYLSGGRILIGLNLEKSVIKEYSLIDAAADYTSVNKHGRHTYQGRADLRFDANDSHQSRLDKIDKSNKGTAYACTQPTGDEDDLFGVEPPMLERPMNEIVLKINEESMVSLSMETSDLKHPDVLLNLIYVQQLFKLHTGKEFPIFLYNTSKEAITTDLADTSPRQIGPNQFFQLNPKIALKQIADKYPELTIPMAQSRAFISAEASEQAMFSNAEIKFKTADFFKMIGFNPTTGEIAGITDKNSPNPSEVSGELDKVRVQLGKMIIPFTSQDGITQTHKALRSEDQQYAEINQANLGKFIRTKILGLQETDKIPEGQLEQYKSLMKAYNLQFRLNIYAQLLSEGKPINYLNLDKDLKYFTKLSKILDKKQSAELNPSSKRSSSSILSSYQNWTTKTQEPTKKTLDEPKAEDKSVVTVKRSV